MNQWYFFCLIGLLWPICGYQCAEQKEGDSYLVALQQSHIPSPGPDAEQGNINREDDFFAYDTFSGSYPTGSDYDYHPAPPRPYYGQPRPVFGPQKPTYGPPRPAYGPPAHHYHPQPYPPPPPQYGPPVPYPPAPYPDLPRDSWLLDKFKLKLDLFTLGKILLKLIIFKKIVKFIAIICLLLFLPKLEHIKDPPSTGGGSGGSHDDYLRRIDGQDVHRINELADFVVTSIDSFTQKQMPDEMCPEKQISVRCRFSHMFDTIDKNYSFSRIFKLYLPSNDVLKTNPNGENDDEGETNDNEELPQLTIKSTAKINS